MKKNSLNSGVSFGKCEFEKQQYIQERPFILQKTFHLLQKLTNYTKLKFKARKIFSNDDFQEKQRIKLI